MKGKGQNFTDFMVEQGLYEEVKDLAAKKRLAAELKAAMEEKKLSKSAVAKKLNTSRVAIDNILDPSFNTSLGSLERFASAVGKRLTVTLE